MFVATDTKKRANPSTEPAIKTEENDSKQQKLTHAKEEIIEEKPKATNEEKKTAELVKVMNQNINKSETAQKDTFVLKLQKCSTHIKNEYLYAIEKSTQEIDLKNIDSGKIKL